MAIRFVAELETLALRRAAREAREDLRQLGAEADKVATSLGRARRSSDDAGRAKERLGGAASGLGQRLRSLAGGAVAVAGAFGVLVGVRGIGGLVSGLLSAGSQTEDYRTRLTRLLGSVEEGNRLFQAMAGFAARVPFEYRDIMDAATTLAGVLRGGVSEIRQWMPLIADLAAATGLGIQATTGQVVRMFSAGAASADLFRERGVLAMLGFEAGVTYSAEKTKQMLLEAWEAPTSKFRDAAQDMGATWSGLTSMLSDAWFAFRSHVLEGGLFDVLKEELRELVELAQSPEVQQLARRIGGELADAVRMLASRTDELKGAAAGLLTIGLLGFFATMVAFASPLSLLVIGVGALVGGLVTLHSKSDTTGKSLGALAGSYRDAKRAADDLVASVGSLSEKQVEAAHTALQEAEAQRTATLELLAKARANAELLAAGPDVGPGGLARLGRELETIDRIERELGIMREGVVLTREEFERAYAARRRLADLDEQIAMDEAFSRWLEAQGDSLRDFASAASLTEKELDKLRKKLQEIYDQNPLRAKQPVMEVPGLDEIRRDLEDRIADLVRVRDAAAAAFLPLSDLSYVHAELERLRGELATVERYLETYTVKTYDARAGLVRTFTTDSAVVAKIVADLKQIPTASDPAARQMERLTGTTVELGDAWFRAAQIMAQSFGEAFGRMGSRIEQFINGLFQVIALMKEMRVIAQGLQASGGAGGGGFLSSLMRMFGGGRGGTALSGSAAGNYFAAGPWMPTAGGGAAAGGFAGLGATGGGALMGLGIGAGIGGLGGQLGLGGYAQEGGAVGGAIGGAIAAAFTGGLGGPAGAAIGGAIGTVVGSLIKRGADEARGLIEGGSFRLTASEGQTGTLLRQVADSVMGGILQFTETIGGQLTAMGGVGLTYREGEGYRVWGGGSAADAGRRQFRTEDQAAAIEEAMFRAIRQTSWEGISENIVKAIHSPLTTDMTTLSHAVEVALAIDNLGIPPFLAGMRQATDALFALRAEGIRYGMDVSNLNREIARTYQDTRDQIVGVEQSEQERRLERAQLFNEEITRVRGEREAELADLMAQLTAAQASTDALTSEALERLGDFGLGIATTGALAGASADVLQARIAELQALLASLPGLITPEELAPRVDPEDARRRREDRERRREERARELEEALDTLGGTLRSAREDAAAYRATIELLSDRQREGTLTTEDYARAVQEASDELFVQFTEGFGGFLERYYGDVAGYEQVRRDAERTRFETELAFWRIQFEIVVELGRLSQETRDRIQGIFAWVENNAPNLGGPAGAGPGLAPPTPAEEFLRRLADAANAPAFQVGRGVLSWVQQLLSYLPDDGTLPGFRIAQGSTELQVGAVGDVAIFDTVTRPVFALIDAEMTAAEARFELEKAIKLLDLEVLRAQLEAVGAFNGFVGDLWERVHGMVLASGPPSGPLTDNTNALNSNTAALREATMDFNELYASLVLGEGGGESDPVAQLAAQFAQLKQLFLGQSFHAMGQWLSAQGVEGLDLVNVGGGQQWLYNGQPLHHVLAAQLYEQVMGPIEDLKLQELFASLQGQENAPILQWFDELRRSDPAVSQRDQLERLRGEFQAAVDLGDQQRVADLGRQLLGVGESYYGIGTAGYRDLHDTVLRLAGGLVGEVPEDLLLRQVDLQEQMLDELVRLNGSVEAPGPGSPAASDAPLEAPRGAPAASESDTELLRVLRELAATQRALARTQEELGRVLSERRTAVVAGARS